MKKNFYFSFLLLILFLFSLFSVPQNYVDAFRYKTVCCFVPAWNWFSHARVKLLHLPTIGDIHETNRDDFYKIDLSQLTLENQTLKTQMEGMYEWLQFEQRIEEQIEQLKNFSLEKHDDLYWNEFIRRRSDNLKKLLGMELQALPAKVIFREPTSWSSSIWVNIGEKDNALLGKSVISKNSPVVLQESLIGVVEYVGEKQSRIRLITDSGLIPSVRAIRGPMQDKNILQLTQSLKELLFAREDLFDSPSEKETFLNRLTHFKTRLTKKGKNLFLAKGELHGSSHPLWRSKGQLLKGIGFNYHYSDEEGPARDLISGQTYEQSTNIEATNLIQEGDLLITTGYDGLFPAGLKVATVTSVGKLQEGGYAYDILAKPTAPSLEELDLVFILPPLEFEKNF